MLLIKCPFCGERTESEFTYGGPVGSDRPDPFSATDAEWVDHLTMVPNPVGPVAERWYHSKGCGRWFTIIRNTLTHEIVEQLDEK